MTIERPMFPPRAEPSRDLAYRRLEGKVCDLDRLCEITFDLFFECVQNPGDDRRSGRAMLIADITRERMREFKATYYDWYKSPPRDDDGHVVVSTVSRR